MSVPGREILSGITFFKKGKLHPPHTFPPVTILGIASSPLRHPILESIFLISKCYININPLATFEISYFYGASVCIYVIRVIFPFLILLSCFMSIYFIPVTEARRVKGKPFFLLNAIIIIILLDLF